MTRAPVVVRRGHLIDRLSSVDEDVRLILLLAPCGYGKTTTLRQWAAESDRTFVWVDLESADSDAGHLVRRIGAALVDLGLLDGAGWQALVADHAAFPEQLVASLVTAVRTAEGAPPVVVVLDDLQRLGAGPALDIVVLLVSSLPRGWHVAAASRRLPARLRWLLTQGLCLQWGATDLALRPPEAARLFSSLGQEIPISAARRIVQRAEGWPVGVNLAALSFATEPRDRSMPEISGDDRYIVDYFRDEVLARQSAVAARFLLRTSPLNELSGALCDAVLETTGSAAWLSQIAAENLFLVRQDPRRQWFRFHRLFAEMLLSELRRREPGEDRRVRRSASRWFEQQGQSDQAIRYAISGEDLPHTEHLILRDALNLINRGQLTVVRDGLDYVGHARLEGDPRFALIGTWVYGLLGNVALAQRLLRAAEGRTVGSGNRALLAGVARARAALAPVRIAAMKADVDSAMANEPPRSSLRALSQVLLGAGCLLGGSTDRAKKAFADAVRLGEADQGPAAALALAERSLLAAEEDDWLVASLLAADSLRIVEHSQLQTYVPSLMTYAACARVEVHKGDVDSARLYARRAARLCRRPSPAAFPWLAAQAHVVLARTSMEVGDDAMVSFNALEAERYLRLVGEDSAATSGSRLRLTADLESLRGQGGCAGETLTASELRVLALLPSHLSLSEISEELFLSRNTVKNQVAAIYRKLAVANRADAVRTAAALSLLHD
ncbi:MAG TPA: LuxR C-terminal-related transcriptional regulator [Kineosporiaceae bacterium]